MSTSNPNPPASWYEPPEPAYDREVMEEKWLDTISYKEVAEQLVDVINDIADAPGTYACRPLFNCIDEGLRRMDPFDVAMLAVGWDVMPSFEAWVEREMER